MSAYQISRGGHINNIFNCVESDVDLPGSELSPTQHCLALKIEMTSIVGNRSFKTYANFTK
jgi:hypothetical protein